MQAERGRQPRHPRHFSKYSLSNIQKPQFIVTDFIIHKTRNSPDNQSDEVRLKYAYQMRATVYGDFFPVCQKYRHSGPKGKELERYLDPPTMISLWECSIQLVYSKCISRTFILISLANFSTENFTETQFTRIHTSSLINSEKILNRSGVTF